MSNSCEKLFCIGHTLTSVYHALLNHFSLLLADFDQIKDARQMGIHSKEELQRYLISKNANKVTKKANSPNQVAKKSTTTQKYGKINHTYLLPTLALLLIELDTCYTYYMASQSTSEESRAEVLSNVFARRTFPRRMWSVSDVMVEVGIYLSAQVYLFLLLDRGLESQFKMYLLVDRNSKTAEIMGENGVSLSKLETERIYAAWKMGLYATRLRMFTVIPVLVLFFGSHLALSWTEHSLLQNGLKVRKNQCFLRLNFD